MLVGKHRPNRNRILCIYSLKKLEVFYKYTYLWIHYTVKVIFHSRWFHLIVTILYFYFCLQNNPCLFWNLTWSSDHLECLYKHTLWGIRWPSVSCHLIGSLRRFCHMSLQSCFFLDFHEIQSLWIWSLNVKCYVEISKQ